MDVNEKQFNDILEVEGIYAKGFGMISKLVMQDTRLTPESKCIYSYFVSYAGQGTQAFPSVSLILYHLGISESRYYRHFKLLKCYGYIKTRQLKTKGKFSRTIYTLVTNPVPSTQNEGTVKSPTPQNECTENESTHFEGYNNNSIKINSIKNKQQQPQKRDDDVSPESTEEVSPEEPQPEVSLSASAHPAKVYTRGIRDKPPVNIISLIDKYKSITGLEDLRPLFLVKLMKELDVGDSYALEKLKLLESNLETVERPLQFFISAMKNDWAQAQAKIKTDTGKGADKNCPDCKGEGWIVTETSAKECVCKNSIKGVG